RPVHLGRVKERHSQLDGSVDGGDGLALVALLRGAVSKAHPHTAESDGRHFQVAVSKFALLHCVSFLKTNQPQRRRATEDDSKKQAKHRFPSRILSVSACA